MRTPKNNPNGKNEVRLGEHAYAALNHERRSDETFDDAIQRLIGYWNRGEREKHEYLGRRA